MGLRNWAGVIQVFLAEALAVPTGLLSAAFLSRMLGPERYGLWMLAIAVVVWVEWSVASMLARAAIKLVSEADDWRDVGAAVVHASLILGIAAGVLLAIVASPLAVLLGEPELTWLLRALAFEIPLFSLAQAHRNVLTGLGRFAGRATSVAARLVVRLVLVLVLVGLGLSTAGVVVAFCGASLAELWICRLYIRPPLFGCPSVSWRRLFSFAGPLFVMGVSLRVFEKIDLVALKALGGTADEAGFYGAAQNLALLPSLIAMSLSPVLLASLGRALRRDVATARALARDAVRAVVLTLPVAALIAGSAPDIVGTIFGPGFAPAATPLALLVFGSWALLLVSVASAILVALDRVNLTVALSVPLAPLALVGHLGAVPAMGIPGAALVTLGGSALGAAAQLIAADRHLGVRPGWPTFARVAAAALAAVTLSQLLPASGVVLLLVKLPAIGLAALVVLGVLGEFTAGELAAAREALAGWLVLAHRLARSHPGVDS